MKWIICLAALSLCACTDAWKAQVGAYGEPQTITLYGASGTVVRVWHSDGKVSEEEHSDGWYFMDRDTKTLVRVSGTVVIEHEHMK